MADYYPDKQIRVKGGYVGSGLEGYEVDISYSDPCILSADTSYTNTKKYTKIGYCKITNLKKSDFVFKAGYKELHDSDPEWDYNLTLPDSGWNFNTYKITGVEGNTTYISTNAAVYDNYDYKAVLYEKDGKKYVYLEDVCIFTNDYHLAWPNYKDQYDKDHPDADNSWDKYVTSGTQQAYGMQMIPITIKDKPTENPDNPDPDNPDEPDPDNPEPPNPSYFEYLVQYTHNFTSMSKDNYLQGLDGHGPNIWLNFDNDGTDNYGTVIEQDAQQKWTNAIFDYKTQNYFEHPTAGCTQSQPQRAGHFAGCRISFRGMGPNTFYGEPCTFTKDDLNLLGFGVTTKFDGIIWTYAFYFVKNSSTIKITKDDTNNTIQILAGLDGCDNGKILCQRIVKALCESPIIKDDTVLKEIFAHPCVDPYHINDPWTIGQDEIIFWNSEHFGVAGGFEPRTLKKTLTLNATYNGPIIKDGKHYDKNDVSATVTYTIPGSSESKTVNLKQEEFTVDSTLVLKENAIGELVCKFTVSYQEQLYGEISPTTFTDTIEVPILYLKEFKAEYTGPYIYIISDYDVNDVTVSLIYNRPEYSKILNQSEYDLSTTTIDKLGINTITVTEHSEDHYQTTFIVIGVRIVLDISAKYVGPPIEVTDQYDPLDVIVSLNTVDNNHENRMTIILKYSPDIIDLIPGVQATNEYLIQNPGLYVTNVGDNIRTVFYKDPLIEATTEFTVPGIPKLVDFETTYISDTRIIGERIYKSEVLAVASWIIDGDYTLETKVLEDNEWEFYDAPIITDANKGYIRTQYKNLMSSVRIKYDIPQTLRLRCWYEGVKIKVGSTYAYEDVPTFLVFPNGDLKRLRVLDLEFSSNYVAEEGWNWYTVTYRTGYYVLSGVFAVPGYIPIIYPDVDFMVKYIDIPNNYREIDYTESFRPKFTFDGVFVITWQQFLAEVNELMLYGLYILTAPKLCGLSNKYDQDWEVLCINKTTLKANIMKTYLKEEDLPWQEQNQLEQQ